MPFKQSIKSLIEEEVMEVKSIIDDFNSDASMINESILENEKIDHQNDKARAVVRRYLLSALRNFNMRDYEGMNNDVHAALQSLDKQGEMDLLDDVPRHEARVRLAMVQGRMTSCSDKLRGFLAKLKEIPND